MNLFSLKTNSDVRGQQANWLLIGVNLMYSVTLKNTEENFTAKEVKIENTLKTVNAQYGY
jgi:hypothetical protein